MNLPSQKSERKPSSKESPKEESANKDSGYPVQICEVCETEMFGLHCKIVCPNCGYKRDCSDP